MVVFKYTIQKSDILSCHPEQWFSSLLKDKILIANLQRMIDKDILSYHIKPVSIK